VSLAGVWFAREQVRLARIQVARTKPTEGVAPTPDAVLNLEKTQLAARETHALRDYARVVAPRTQETTESLGMIVSSLRKKIETQPDNVLLRLQLAQNVLQLGEVSEAESTIGDAARRFPSDARPPALLAKVLLEHKDAQGARKAAEEALAIDSHLAYAHMLLGIALDRLGFERSALQALRYAISLDPTAAIAHQRIGFIALRSFDYTQAEISFTNALELDHSVTNILALGATFVSEGRQDDTIVALNAARTLAPTRFMAGAKEYKPDFSAALVSMSPDLDELCGRFLLSTQDLQPDGSLDGFEIALIRGLLGTKNRVLFGKLESALIDMCIVPQFMDTSPLCSGLRSFGLRQPSCPDNKANVLGMISSEVMLPASEIPCAPS
jgi:tetratricopeptide (TPR) repeat protein